MIFGLFILVLVYLSFLHTSFGYHHLPSSTRYLLHAQQKSKILDTQSYHLEPLRVSRADEDYSKKRKPSYRKSGGGGGSGESMESLGGLSGVGGGRSIRQARLARSLRDEISQIIGDIDIKATVYPEEDLLRSTSIVDIDISADLSVAKVYITVLGNSVAKRQIFVWLSENVGQVRYSLAKRLRHMKKIPEISFKLADTKATADLMAMIDEVSSSSENNSNAEEFEFEE